jgi:hypothetical protein
LEVARSDAADTDGLDGLEVAPPDPVDVGVAGVVAVLWIGVIEVFGDREVWVAVAVACDAGVQSLALGRQHCFKKPKDGRHSSLNWQ